MGVVREVAATAIPFELTCREAVGIKTYNCFLTCQDRKFSSPFYSFSVSYTLTRSGQEENYVTEFTRYI